MQTENRFFEDFAKLANGLVGTLAGAGREAQDNARERMRDWLGGSEAVSRDEFEAVKAMAAAARDEADVLRARLDALEAAEVGEAEAAAPYSPSPAAGDTPPFSPPAG